MALRVLSSEEREILENSAAFALKAKWAVKNYASYWSEHNGSGLPDTEVARVKWVKDRFLSVDIHTNSKNLQPASAFANLIKSMQFDLPAEDQNVESLIAAIPAGKYEELASMYFDLLGESINFSIKGS